MIKLSTILSTAILNFIRSSIPYFLLLSPSLVFAQDNPFGEISDTKLANGQVFPNWEKKQVFKHTFYVDCNNTAASDQNPGTVQKPFKTISKSS
ncbi:MAG: hypothetical protein HC905_03730 [Bacteroidales bacterium]|nr:hypothetical protein [Bacteroidales bacterium]